MEYAIGKTAVFRTTATPVRTANANIFGSASATYLLLTAGIINIEHFILFNANNKNMDVLDYESCLIVNLSLFKIANSKVHIQLSSCVDFRSNPAGHRCHRISRFGIYSYFIRLLSKAVFRKMFKHLTTKYKYLF